MCCHRGLPFFTCSGDRKEWLVLLQRARVMAQQQRRRRHYHHHHHHHHMNLELPRVVVEGGGVPTSKQQYCLCSPTQHPGSFRCRQHLGEYQWVGRLQPKSGA